MRVKAIVSQTLCRLCATALSLAMIQLSMGPTLAAAAQAQNDLPSPGSLGNPQSPIKHVIVIIGENRSFDHVFATYQPTAIKGRPQEVLNLLSEGIVNLKGTTVVPGPNWQRAVQKQVTSQESAFLLSPPSTDYKILPNPLAGGPSGQFANLTGFCTTAAACTALAEEVETGLPTTSYYGSLASGGTGLTSGTPDTRIQWDGYSVQGNNLLPGPFQLTSATLAYTAYAASPVHRFYQMQQQLNCQPREWNWLNPSGCDGKLFAWVETTFGAGSNGNLPGYTGTPGAPDDVKTGTFATNFTTGETPAPVTTGEGSTALGFYNVQQGDVPYFKQLADTYAMSDNFHQSFLGGTGANHIMLGHGAAIYFQDQNGNAVAPPNPASNPQGALSEIENPNPNPAAVSLGSNNWYTQDGYGGFDKAGSDYYGGGTYSDCSDSSQPGVAPVLGYIHSLGVVDSRCEAGHYYLLNNYNPGYEPQLSNEDAGTFNGTWQDAYYQDYAAGDGATAFTIPPNRNGNGKDPSKTNSIGDTLNNAGISWKYYGDQLNVFHTDPHVTNNPAKGQLPDEYCQICNPFQYDQSIMESADVNKHIQDSTSLYADIASGTNLPAVSFVKPSGFVDGHPASSKLDLFEGFVKKIVDEVQSSAYANDTAIFITFDEGGGYYDSGYVQPVDFFGDGTRIPLIVVAPTQYLKGGGYISHQYADHVSILKFVERNWRLPTVTPRSRDNLPNPQQLPVSRGFRGFVDTAGYVPYVNGVPGKAAIDDLWDFFDFPSSHRP